MPNISTFKKLLQRANVNYRSNSISKQTPTTRLDKQPACTGYVFGGDIAHHIAHADGLWQGAQQLLANS